MTKKIHVGMIAQRPIVTAMSEAKAMTARVTRRVADERGLDVMRHRVAQRERVRGHEEGTHDDRDRGDHDRALERRPLVFAQAGETPRRLRRLRHHDRPCPNG
jgi:hypothetical protein